MKYDIIGYRKYTAYDKVYLTVDANSTEEAMQLAKEQPDEYEVNYKGLNVTDSEWVDLDEWIIKERK